MPRNGKSGRGDLIVSFDIEFPEELSLEKKRQVVELLKV
jgi:DnaJ-class molecular chaperone